MQTEKSPAHPLAMTFLGNYIEASRATECIYVSAHITKLVRPNTGFRLPAGAAISWRFPPPQLPKTAADKPRFALAHGQ